MLRKLEQKAPAAGELQHRIDKLSELLAPPKLPNGALAAVKAFNESTKAVEAARRDLSAAIRAYPSQRGFGPTPEVYAAQELAKAEEAKRERLRLAIDVARERVDEVWLAAVMPQIEFASVTLLDLASLLHESVAPICDLQSYAFRNQLGLPRLLAAAPAMQEAVRQFTALLNQATAPTAAASIDEDLE